MNTHRYLGFSIAIHTRLDEKGKPCYWYEIRGTGLRKPVETDETFEDAARALETAKDFIDEHLA